MLPRSTDLHSSAHSAPMISYKHRGGNNGSAERTSTVMYAMERGVTFPFMWKISHGGLRMAREAEVRGFLVRGSLFSSLSLAVAGPVKTAL
jgi:hypothetical protein